jgi:hypothetical protein
MLRFLRILKVRDATSSLGDATRSLGDAKSSLGDATSSLGDAKSSLGDANSWPSCCACCARAASSSGWRATCPSTTPASSCSSSSSPRSWCGPSVAGKSQSGQVAGGGAQRRDTRHWAPSVTVQAVTASCTGRNSHNSGPGACLGWLEHSSTHLPHPSLHTSTPLRNRCMACPIQRTHAIGLWAARNTACADSQRER